MAKGSKRTGPVYVPCGRCGYCLKNRQLDWSFRLKEEFRNSTDSYFITVTYNDENVPRNEYGQTQLSIRDHQLFIKSLRKAQKSYTRKKLRYYVAGEYGQNATLRPHMHYLIFNLHGKTIKHKLLDSWKAKGNIDLQICDSEEAVSNYVASYIVTKYDFKNANPSVTPPFQRCSTKPALGSSYIKRMGTYHRKLNEPYLQRGEQIQRLPRYIRERIWQTTIRDPKTGKLKNKYNPPSSWKQNAIENGDHSLSAEVHRQRLLNGDNWDGFNYIEKQRIYHEQLIKSNAKKTTKL